MAGDHQTLTLVEEDRPPPPLPPPPAANARTPLLDADNSELGRALLRLEAFLAGLGFHHHCSPLGLLLTAFAFLVLGVATPAVAIYFSRCSRVDGGCEHYQVDSFELCVLVSEVSLAAVCLASVSRNLFKYGIRKFLFVDQHHGQAERFQKEYVKRIQDFFCFLLWWILPCFLVKIAREVMRFAFIFKESMWRSIVVLFASTMSWAYLTTVFLSACILFNLVCNLQVVHFDDYSRLLERDMDALVYLEEHTRLRYNLSKISHRFRIFLLLIFLFVTTSQFVTLFQITGYSGAVNFTNAGDLAVSSVVQVVGIVLCLHAAAKISHRAQGIASLACRWHALVTCSSNDSPQRGITNSSGNSVTVPVNSLILNFSESDLESLDNVSGQSNDQLVSYMCSYHKRLSLVMYLQSNPGGLTIFGWIVNRELMNTVFFLELTLVLFVLSKTIAFPAG